MKVFKFLIIVVAILATVLIGVNKPALLKKVRIDNANLAVENQKTDTNSKEDSIAWNSWHSTLSNKILKDNGVPQNEEINTVNVIQFNVDNKKNISNIKISAIPEKYSKNARKHYIDYLNDLNGNDSLAFPKDSKRKVVTIQISITASNKTKYSKPEDFSDYETIGR